VRERYAVNTQGTHDTVQYVSHGLDRKRHAGCMNCDGPRNRTYIYIYARVHTHVDRQTDR